MRMLVSEDIKICNPTHEVMCWAQNKLTLPNPDFYKKEKLGKWVGNTPKELKLYVTDYAQDMLIVPFGCMRNLWAMHPIKSDWSIEICPIQPKKYKSNIELYDYQEKAVTEALRAKNGVIVMPCGAGKTQAGMEIISRIGGRALWLTHTSDLLNQSKARAESVLDLPYKNAYGTITGGKVVMGECITFATVQTMANLDLIKYKDCFDIVIVDECQHCCGTPTQVTQFYKVVNSLSARYKYGLTATPKRADGLESTMFSILGGKIYEVSREEVAHTTCEVRVQTIETGYVPNYNEVLMGDGTLDYSAIINDMVSNKERMEFVAENIKICIGEGATLVLANRVKYLNDLRELVGGRSVVLSGMGTSKKAKEERKEALRKLNNGELDAVFCTYQLAAEGLDCPNLKYVVFATPEKDPTRIQQASGRVGRKADGKSYGTVIDFVDDFGMYKGWAKKRESIYKKLGYNISGCNMCEILYRENFILHL